MSEENINILEKNFREELKRQQYIYIYPILDYESYIKQSQREASLYFFKCYWFYIMDWFKNIFRRG